MHWGGLARSYCPTHCLESASVQSIIIIMLLKELTFARSACFAGRVALHMILQKQSFVPQPSKQLIRNMT